jgi:hypothetical protein
MDLCVLKNKLQKKAGFGVQNAQREHTGAVWGGGGISDV